MDTSHTRQFTARSFCQTHGDTHKHTQTKAEQNSFCQVFFHTHWCPSSKVSLFVPTGDPVVHWPLILLCYFDWYSLHPKNMSSCEVHCLTVRTRWMLSLIFCIRIFQCSHKVLSLPHVLCLCLQDFKHQSAIEELPGKGEHSIDDCVLYGWTLVMWFLPM